MCRLGYQYWRKPMRTFGQFDDAWRCIGEAMTAIETTKERWWEAEVNRIAGEIALQVARAGCGESGSVFRARARGRPPTTSQILGTPRRHEPRTPLARPGQGAASARTAGSGLRVVHRRVRHARSEGGEGAAGGVGGVRPQLRSIGTGREHRPKDQCHSVNVLALRDHGAPICIFLCFARRPAASLGRVPCGVQDRVRERQEGFLAANQRRRVCKDWPLVAASLLVLPPIVTRRPNAPTAL